MSGKNAYKCIYLQHTVSVYGNNIMNVKMHELLYFSHNNNSVRETVGFHESSYWMSFKTGKCKDAASLSFSRVCDVLSVYLTACIGCCLCDVYVFLSLPLLLFSPLFFLPSLSFSLFNN